MRRRIEGNTGINNEKDIRVDSFTPGEAAGITHIPTGLYAYGNIYPTKTMNKCYAMGILVAKLDESYKHPEINEERLERELPAFREAVESFTKKATMTKESANKALVESGIYMENGELSEHYRTQNTQEVCGICGKPAVDSPDAGIFCKDHAFKGKLSSQNTEEK